MIHVGTAPGTHPGKVTISRWNDETREFDLLDTLTPREAQIVADLLRVVIASVAPVAEYPEVEETDHA